ncbi:MAG TPA: AzlD domain-containing protein [Tepidiformaceae bacterium]|jgi:branched-subunit amino acid transport protein
MNETWTMILVIGAVTMGIKAAGPVALGGRELPGRLVGVVAMLAPALLAALVATQTFAGDQRLTIDERALGLAVAAVAVALRAPVLVVIVLAAAVTALARAV